MPGGVPGGGRPGGGQAGGMAPGNVQQQGMPGGDSGPMGSYQMGQDPMDQ